MDRFPHLSDTNFPDIDTVDVFKYRNEFDYTRYSYTQMKITMCAVPWDMGEAHIGARTISGIGNVVWFESEANRDAWFAAIPNDKCLRFSTKYRDLHTANYIDLPIPYDVACNYNYIAVEYSLLANDDSPVDYETSDGLRKWFWFIREVEFRGANSTRIHLMIDAWQTFMYRVDVTGMMLERGHAPMASVDADTYLADPLNNCAHLLAPDVDYGAATIAKGQSEVIFNAGNMLAVFITTARPAGTWGSKAGGNWQTPGAWNNTEQGNPAYVAFCMAASNLSGFLTTVNASYPQFVPTIKAIAFISANMVTLGDSFTFAGVACNYLTAHYKQNDLITLDKDLFGYSSRYENIAKLYTSPYAHIELTDENGNVTEVRVEDTRGTLYLETCLNLVFPWLAIDGHITGIGSGGRRTVSFSHVTNRTMPIRGNWYDTVRSWNIPTFGIYQDAEKNNDYAEFYDRAQAVTAYTNAYENAAENAALITDNAALAVAANTASTTSSNSSATRTAQATNSYNFDVMDGDNAIIDAGATATIAASEQQAAVAAASGAASGVIGALGSALTGNIPGAVGGLANTIIGGVSTMASTNISIHLTAAEAQISKDANENHAEASSTKTSDDMHNQQVTATGITNAQNTLTSGQAANSAAATLANAARDRNTAQSAIANRISSAGISQPVEFGAWNNGNHAPTRPLGMFANVVTESAYAIQRAGDEFLRYGYAYNGAWDFDGDWNVCDRFTYWKLSDFWVKGLNLPDAYMDRLRFFLFGGVTIWRRPEDIGNISIYENGL